MILLQYNSIFEHLSSFIHKVWIAKAIPLLGLGVKPQRKTTKGETPEKNHKKGLHLQPFFMRVFLSFTILTEAQQNLHKNSHSQNHCCNLYFRKIQRYFL